MSVYSHIQTTSSISGCSIDHSQIEPVEAADRDIDSGVYQNPVLEVQAIEGLGSHLALLSEVEPLRHGVGGLSGHTGSGSHRMR